MWICDCLLAGNAGSNHSRGLDVALLGVLCVVRWRSLSQVEHSSGGVLLSVVCLECDRKIWPTRGCCALRKKCIVIDIYFVVSNCELWGTAVGQWLRCCATNRKVAGSIPAGVIGIFHGHKILPIPLWPWGRLSF